MKRVFSSIGIVSSLLTFLFIFLFEQNNGVKFLKIGENGLSFIGTISIFLAVFTFAFSLYSLFNNEKYTYLKNTLFGCLLLSLIISLGFYLVKVDFQKEETPEEEVEEKQVEITDYEVFLDDYETDLIFKNGGTYLLKGTFEHTIQIDTEDSITFLLNNVSITSSLAFHVLNGKLVIECEANSSNIILSKEGIISNGDILIKGSGSLTMNVSSFGISSNNLTLENTNLMVSSKKDGILSNVTLNNSNFYLEVKETGITGVTTITDGITFISAEKGFSDDYTNQSGTLLLLEEELSSKDMLTFYLEEELEDDVFSVEKTGEEIISFKSPSPFHYLSLSLDSLEDGTYYLFAGGNHEGELFYGIYEKGLLIGSTKISESALESNIIAE